METTESNSIFCSNCGTKNEANSSFCSACGSKLKKEESTIDILKKETTNSNYTNNQSETDQFTSTNKSSEFIEDNYTQEELNLFVSKNQMYYFEKFNKIKSTGSKGSWNWASCLCGVYWMFYRKMYFQGIIFAVIAWVLSCIPTVGWLLNLCMWIAVGIFGNSLYLSHVDKAFEQIKLADGNMRSMLINKKGGTNIILPIILIILPIIILSIMLIVLGSAIFSLAGQSPY